MTKRSKAIQWLTNSRRRFTVNNKKSYRLVLFKTLQKEKNVITLLTVALVACIKAVLQQCPVAPGVQLLPPGDYKIFAFSQKSYAGHRRLLSFRALRAPFNFSQSTITYSFERKPLVMQQIVGQFLRLKPTQYKWVQHCWLIAPNIVGCYMLYPFAVTVSHVVACRWELLHNL